MEGLKLGIAWPMMLMGDKTTDEINKTSEKVLMVCAAPEVVSGQYVGVAIKYLSEHPETRHNSARMLILESFQQAFPCK